MYRYIKEHYWDGKLNAWERESRFGRLRLLDAWLDGKFYDNIPSAFCEETASNGDYIPIHDRRPSIQRNYPRMIANITSRKLFGGRHTPRLMHKDKAFKKQVETFVQQVKLASKMLNIIRRGSVGSVCVRFHMDRTQELATDAKGVATAKQGRLKTVVKTINSRFVTPTFDDFEELEAIRVHYVASGSKFLAEGYTMDYLSKPIDPRIRYWYVEDLDGNNNVFYKPIPANSWNPHDGDKSMLRVHNEITNDLGFVPAIWINNTEGGSPPDGECFFEFGLDNFVTNDYMWSQNGRGLFYHAAPQMVVKGEIVNWEDGPNGQPRLVKNTANIIQLESDVKSPLGETITGSDAKLLETTGAGLKVGLEYSEKLQHGSLEQVSAARKDPETIKGPMSGTAMKLIDQEFLDFVQELRVMYCEYGYLLLIKKMCKAAAKLGGSVIGTPTDDTIDGLTLQYPADYVPSPQEFLNLVEALDIAINGAAGGSMPKPPSDDGEDKAAAPVLPIPEVGMITLEEASLWLKMQMDFYIESEDDLLVPTESVSEPNSPRGGTDDILHPDDGSEDDGKPGDEYLEQIGAPAQTQVRALDIPF